MCSINLPDTYEFESTTRDQQFEPFHEFQPAETEKVAEFFLPICEAVMPRKRRWREKDLANFKLVLATVIANALRASENRPSKLVFYSRRAETYTSDDLNLPPFLRYKNLIHAVDALAAAGLLESYLTPSTRSWFDDPNARQSTFGATDKLLQALKELGVTQEHIGRNGKAPVVILKDTEKKLKRYDPNEPFIRSMITTIKDYNAFLDSHDLRLDVTDDELEAMHEEMASDAKPRSPVNFNDTHLRRIFNNSTFEQGGRWFGGWWQLIPSEYRSQILINGEQTTELDYSCCFPRMIYHLEGSDNGEEDLYFIPELAAAAEAQGLNWESVRDSVKKLFNILINAGPEHRIGKVSGLCLPKGFKRPNKVYPLIEKKHEAVARWFRSGAGLQLMNRESAICEAILTEGVAQSILVLPIHDSFVVQARHKGWLRDVMVSCYRDQIGFEPRIKDQEKDDDNKLDYQIDEPLPEAVPYVDFSLEETVSEVEDPWPGLSGEEGDLRPTPKPSSGPIIIGPDATDDRDAIFRSLID